MAGSKAVVAARLSPTAATLLWESLTGPTSDVSVELHAYYEAILEAYGARVTADVETVYSHFSRIQNKQKDYTRRQLRRVVDELHQNGVLKVEELDRTTALGIKEKSLSGILSAVTDKLTELMFDHETGWSKSPEREAAVEANQILGRQERGWFSSTFGGTEDTKYYTDDQFVLKRREDVQQRSFSLILSQNTSIKVPVDTAGNLHAVFTDFNDRDRYFRVVNTDDPDFEFREVHFQLDNDYASAFADTLNLVTVSVRKLYAEQPAFTKALVFTHQSVAEAKTLQHISFPRLGVPNDDWTAFDYRVRWSFRDGTEIEEPRQANQWLRSKQPAVSLRPPLDVRKVMVDADQTTMTEAGFRTAIVEFAVILNSKAKVAKTAVIRASEASASKETLLYFDRGEPVTYRIEWHGPKGVVRQDLKVLDSNYLFIPAPPSAAPGK